MALCQFIPYVCGYLSGRDYVMECHSIRGKMRLLDEENLSFHIIMFTSTCAGPDTMLCEG
jgi:hypothetical protein